MRRIIITAWLVSLFLASSIHAATYHVAKTGGGSTCSEASPCLTIATGIGKLAAGDTLIIHAGTYAEQVTVPVAASGTSGNHTTIQAADGETVWVKPNAISSGGIWNISHSAHHITLLNFKIDGANLGTDGVESDGLIVNRHSTGVAHNIIIDGIEIKNIIGENEDAVNLRYGTHSNIVRNCYIHDVNDSSPGVTPNQCIYFQGSEPGLGSIIEDNICDNTANGFSMRGDETVGHDDGIIRRNLLINLRDRAFNIEPYVNNLKIHNNIVAGACQGFKLANDTTQIYNNTIYDISTIGDCTSYTIYRPGPAAPTATQAALIKNNIFYQGTHLEFVPSGNFTTNPLFVNVAIDDYRLQSSSTAINTAAIIAAVTHDFAQVARPQPPGGAYDYGAYEWVAQGGDETPPTNVAITDPTDTQTISTSPYTISATAQDETAMARVDFYVDGVKVGEDTSAPAPWTFAWNTRAHTNGEHTLRVRAYDTSNNETISDPITVTLDNTGDITTGLVSHWPLDNSAEDTVGSNEGTPVGSPTYTTGRVGTHALQLNGTSQYVNVGTDSSLNIANGTVAFWMQPAASSASTQGAVSRNGSGAVSGDVLLKISGSGASPVSAVQYDSVDATPASDTLGTTAAQFSPNWTHVAITFGTGGKKLYLNGVLNASNARTEGMTNTAEPFLMGAGITGSLFFGGLLDDVRVYSRQLDVIDVEALVDLAGTDTTPPSDVENLTATVLIEPESSADVQLDWDAATDASGIKQYHVERCAGDGCVDFAAYLIVTPNFAFDEIEPGIRYRYRVKAEDNAGNLSENWSNIAEIRILSFIADGVIDSIAGLTSLPFISDGVIDSVAGLSALPVTPDGVIDSVSGLTLLEFIPDGQIDAVSVD